MIKSRVTLNTYLKMILFSSLCAALTACSEGENIDVQKVVVEDNCIPLQSSVMSQESMVNPEHAMLTDPFLQLPTETGVNVVWFTNYAGDKHVLHYSDKKCATASSIKLTRMMEDGDSKQLGKEYDKATYRDVYRHEATATGLTAGERVNYFVSSKDKAGFELKSDRFTLAPKPAKGQSLKILLTSDLQTKKNVAANYQKVIETVGRVDAVFFAGDFVNVPDRASEWFDQAKIEAPAFFPVLQGHHQDYVPDSPYTGGEILQHAPLYGTIGNHEVMGRYWPENEGYKLNSSFNDPQPKWYAQVAYEKVKATINPTDDETIKQQWLSDNSHNQKNFLEIFSFPENSPQAEEYYAESFGDVFLISMNVSRIWRSWSVKGNQKSKFLEKLDTLENPEQWGFGEFLFERFDRDSEQYIWLKGVLSSAAFKNAKYKVVMAHQGVFGLGDNALPVLSQPVLQLVKAASNGTEVISEFTFPINPDTWGEKIEPHLSEITEVRYQYPLAADVWLNDIEPLLIENGVDLVHIGHSHVWDRAVVGKMNYFESSNVGNTYGAYYNDVSGVYTKNTRAKNSGLWNDMKSEKPRWLADNYPPNGDPHGRVMSLPTVFSPMSMENKNYPALPFVASNSLSVFSILDTETATVKSYVFDAANVAGGEVKLFDEFALHN